MAQHNMGTVISFKFFLTITRKRFWLGTLAFYGLNMLLAGLMVNSTLEEKENRVTETILTTLKPTTLITGKVVTLFKIGLLQALVSALPVVIGFVFFS
ncbi:MAG: hypothetical protein HIU81_13415 [Acidobacteria bacterium]|nr:hypothetical protein [Acidobacteriota bacterium]